MARVRHSRHHTGRLQSLPMGQAAGHARATAPHQYSRRAARRPGSRPSWPRPARPGRPYGPSGKSRSLRNGSLDLGNPCGSYQPARNPRPSAPRPRPRGFGRSRLEGRPALAPGQRRAPLRLWAPHHVEGLAALFDAVERVGAWPTGLAAADVVLLTKPGGSRQHRLCSGGLSPLAPGDLSAFLGSPTVSGGRALESPVGPGGKRCAERPGRARLGPLLGLGLRRSCRADGRRRSH